MKKKNEKPAKTVVLIKTARSKSFITFGFDSMKNAKAFAKEARTKGGCETYLYRLVQS